MLNRLYNLLISDKLKDNIIIYSDAKNIINVALISILAIPFYSFIYYMYAIPQVTYILLMVGILFAASVLALKFIGSLDLSREIFVGSLYLCLILISLMTSGYSSPTSIWLILPPILAIIFGSTKSGICWGFIIISTFLTLFFFNDLSITPPNFDINTKKIIHLYSRCGLTIVLILLAYFFNLGKKEAIFHLEVSNQEAIYLTEKAQEAVRVKNEFLGNISHELRTPLNNILGFAELILNKKISEENTDEFYNIILSSSKELKKMIENILVMSQIEFNTMQLSFSFINLPALIDEVKMLHHNYLREKNLHLNVTIDPTINTIKTDPDKLRLVLSNFISNAIKFSPENKRIEIRTFASGDNHFCIEVEDQGIGIKKEDINRLFVPFSQLDMSMSKQYQGVGIGLALTRRIAEALNGKVGVKSELGQGSIFFIDLPKG